MIEKITEPWPWYVAGFIIGLIVPTLLILGNKHFGISANLRHMCAACFPSNIPFFNYDWKKESWNLFFIGGILVGGILSTQYLSSPDPVIIHPDLAKELTQYGIFDFSGLVPVQLFSFESLFGKLESGYVLLDKNTNVILFAGSHHAQVPVYPL